MHKYWGCASFVAVATWTIGAAAQTDLWGLEDLASDCDPPAWLSVKPADALYFAPMKRLSEAEKAKLPPGGFGYKYVYVDNKTPRYPVASSDVGTSRPAVSLGSYNQSLWLVLDIQRPDVGKIPSDHLWLVISVPRDDLSFHAQFHGHKDFVDDAGGDALRRNYRRAKNIKGSRVKDGDIDVLAFVKESIPPSDTMFLSDFWKMALDKSYDGLVEPTRDHYDSNVKEDAYEHFFSYVKIEKEERNRYPVIKSIRKKGKAFGFLLDNEHKCLVSTTIEIVD